MAKPFRCGAEIGRWTLQSSPLPEFRETGCVTRLDAVPLRTSLKQGKRQKPVPHHRPALTGRKSSTGEFPRASCAPLRLPVKHSHKNGLELQAGPDGAILQGG